MDALFSDFSDAQKSCDGFKLSRTISPALPFEKLRSVWKSCNADDVKNVVKRGIHNTYISKAHALPKDETAGWIEVYSAYWKAVGALVKVRESPNPSNKVGFIPFHIRVDPSFSHLSQSPWANVYESWKEVVSLLHRGYLAHGFEAWTVPCLYVAGKYLREFAVKADEERTNSSSLDSSAEANFQDDFNPEAEQHEKLEDCARQLNRLFNLCLSDRLVWVLCRRCVHRLTVQQGAPRQLSQMGHLPCRQPSLQDILQTQLGPAVKQHLEDVICRSR